MRTIRSSKEIDRIFRSARKTATSTVIVLVAETPPGRGPMGRVAFIAGKKTGGAVRRNRSKRLLREAARAAGAPWDGYDVVLMARADTADAKAQGVYSAVENAIRRAELR